MNLSSLSRTVVKPNYAVLTPESRVPSEIPGWVNATVHVLVSEGMGAGFCQMLVETGIDFKATGQTEVSQIFIYVVRGKGEGNIGGTRKQMSEGHFVYVPAGMRYELSAFQPGSQLLIFQKEYRPLKGQAAPSVLFGDSNAITPSPFMNDDSLQLQLSRWSGLAVRDPSNQSFFGDGPMVPDSSLVLSTLHGETLSAAIID